MQVHLSAHLAQQACRSLSFYFFFGETQVGFFWISTLELLEDTHHFQCVSVSWVPEPEADMEQTPRVI